MENRLLNFEHIPQALIVRLAPLSNFDAFIKKILKAIVCPEHGCGKCIWCEKIENNNYFDLRVFNAKEMKKQDVLDLISRYSRPGLETSNIQMYVIKNIEYASKSILNSLLKFVEEPPIGVYAIFSTHNYDAIIPTIRSRCFNIYLEKDTNEVEDFLSSKQLPPLKRKVLEKSFTELNEMKNQFDKFNEFYELITQLSSSDRLSFASIGLTAFRKMEYYEINLFLEITKNLYPTISNEIIQLQDNLYLNSPKSLIYNQVYELLGKVK